MKKKKITASHIQTTALNRTRPAWEINRKHMSRTDGHTDQRTEAGTLHSHLLSLSLNETEIRFDFTTAALQASGLLVSLVLPLLVR